MAQVVTTVLDGKQLSADLAVQLKSRIVQEKSKPHLCVITVGDDPASQVYVKQKRLFATKIGALFSQSILPAEATLDELWRVICENNENNFGFGLKTRNFYIANLKRLTVVEGTLLASRN